MGLSETLKAISAPVRREILDYLKSGPKSAGEISQQFDLAPATVSHHLSTLRKAGLIEEEKQKNKRRAVCNRPLFCARRAKKDGYCRGKRGITDSV